ncbi:hypothetical protein RhiirA5_379459, partial [Rhizophagus irregularis]
MLYLLVQVNESIKCVISERVVSIEAIDNKFSDLFDAITLGQYNDREVKVFIRQEKSENWREVDNGLKGDLKILEVLGFLRVKFCFVESNLNTQDIPIPTQNRESAFSILMQNSRKLLLPQRITEYNNCDRLYNEIIELLQDLKVGWMGGVHDTIGKIFVNRIKDAIWYIDPHHSTLNARSCHLPILFTQLKTYQDGDTYNQYYHSGHHKKIQLSQHKLLQLSSSLGLSISQPWASNDIWNQVVPAILSLIGILEKYVQYLNEATIIMTKHHHCDESARGPENNCIMYRTAACKRDNLKDKYKQLNNLLFEKQVYEHVNIQQYLPNDVMKRYRFIKELQLMFPIGIYRYHQGSHLGTINFVWKIPEAEEFNDEQNETLKARMLARIHEGLPHYFTRQMQKNVLNK